MIRHPFASLIVSATALMMACGDVPLPVKTRFALCLDPTVSNGQWVDGVLDQLQAVIPEDSEMPVWFVDQDLVAKSGPVLLNFPFDDRQKTRKRHEAKVIEDFGKLKKEYQARWEAAHTSQGTKVPTSCLFTTLQQLSRYLRERTDDQRRTYLVVASDLLEACSEWGAKVNLENQSAANFVLPDSAKSSIDLSRIVATVVIVARSPRISTPAAEDALTKRWTEVFHELKAENVWLVRDVAAVRSRLAGQ